MNANNKSVIITLCAAIIAAFFMPWVKFFVSISAWDMLFGDVGRYIDTGFKYIAVLIPISSGIILYEYIANNTSIPISRSVLFRTPAITMVIILIALIKQINNLGETVRLSDLNGLFRLFGIGFWLTIIASFILAFIKHEITPISLINQPDNVLPTSESVEIPKLEERAMVEQKPIELPKINVNLPKIDWQQTGENIKGFIQKNKALLASLAGAVLVFSLAYIFFIKANPLKEAKNLAKNYCKCSEDQTAASIASLQKFLTGFDSMHFKTRRDARQALNSVLAANQGDYETCAQTITTKYTEMLAEYRAKNTENANIFEQTFQTITAGCGGTTTNEIVDLNNRIDTKILAIIEIEPSIEKIEQDLIGQEVIGWKFSYLSEFRSAEILTKNAFSDRIEYKVKFLLTDNSTTSEHECEMMIVYNNGYSGWELQSTDLDYITYTYTVYPDRYTQISPIENTKWNAENIYKLSWKTSEWEFAGETITGPEIGSTTLPSSSLFYVKSLEETEVKVKFTYQKNL